MTECPVNAQELFSALINGSFRPFTKMDEMTYAGVEYSGYTWTPRLPNIPHGNVVVILDHGPGGMNFQVIHSEPDSERPDLVWDVMVHTPEFKAIMN